MSVDSDIMTTSINLSEDMKSSDQAPRRGGEQAHQEHRVHKIAVDDASLHPSRTAADSSGVRRATVDSPYNVHIRQDLHSK